MLVWQGRYRGKNVILTSNKWIYFSYEVMELLIKQKYHIWICLTKLHFNTIKLSMIFLKCKPYSKGFSKFSTKLSIFIRPIIGEKVCNKTLTMTWQWHYKNVLNIWKSKFTLQGCWHSYCFRFRLLAIDSNILISIFLLIRVWILLVLSIVSRPPIIQMKCGPVTCIGLLLKEGKNWPN